MTRTASIEKSKDMDESSQKTDTIDKVESNSTENELSQTDLCYDEYLEGKFNGAFEHDTTIFTKM